MGFPLCFGFTIIAFFAVLPVREVADAPDDDEVADVDDDDDAVNDVGTVGREDVTAVVEVNNELGGLLF